MRTSLVLLALACGLAVCAAQLMNAAVTSTATGVSTATTATVTFTSTKGQVASALNTVNLPCFSQACTCSASGASLSQVAATPQVTYTAPSASCPAAGTPSASGTVGTSAFTVSNSNGPALQSASYVGFAVTASTTSAANNLIVDGAGAGATPTALGGLTVALTGGQAAISAANAKSGAVTDAKLVFNYVTGVVVPVNGQIIINLPYNYLQNQVLTADNVGTPAAVLGTCPVVNVAANPTACPPVTASATITCTVTSNPLAAAAGTLSFAIGWKSGSPGVTGTYTVQTMTALGGSIIEGPAATGLAVTPFTSSTLTNAALSLSAATPADLDAQVGTTAGVLTLVFTTVSAVPALGAFVLTTPVGYFRTLAFTGSSGTTGGSATAACLKTNPTTSNDVWTCTTATANSAMPASTAITWTSAGGSWSVLNNQAAGVFSVSTQTPGSTSPALPGFVIDAAVSSASGGAPAIQTVGTMSVGAISFAAAPVADNNPGLSSTTGALTIAGIASSILLKKSETKLVFTFPYRYISIVGTAAFTTAGGAGATGTCSTSDVVPTATCPSTVTAGSTTMTCAIGAAQDWTTATNSLILTAGQPWRIASNTASGSFTLQAQSINSGIITGSGSGSVVATGGQATVAAATNSVVGDKLPGVTTTGNLVLGVNPASSLSTASTIVFTLPANYLIKTTSTTFAGVTISTAAATVACTMAQATAATTCAAAGTTSTISCVTGGAVIPSGAVASVTFAAGSWSLANGATGSYTATTYNNLGLLVDKTSAGLALITATASGAVSNVQAAVFSKSTDQVPGLVTTTGTLTFTFTTATTIPSGSIAIVFQSQGYLNTVGAFTTTMGSPSGAGPSGSCTLSSQFASCAVGASVATCGVSSAAVAATQTLTCPIAAPLTAGVVTLILTAGTYTVGSSQPASKYTVTTSTTVSMDAAGTTMGNLPALAAGAVSAVSTAAFSIAGDMVPGTTSTGTLTFGFTTATDLISGSLILVTLPAGYLSAVTSAKLGTATISCNPTAPSPGCPATTIQLLTCTTQAAVTKGAQSLVLQIGGFVMGPKNAAAGTSYRVATATAAGVVIDTAGSGSVPAITAGGSASGSGTATASVAADLVPGATTSGTLTLAFMTQTKVPTTGGKIVFSLTQGWLNSAAAATLTGGSPATTSTCSMAFSAGSAASGCTAAAAATYTCTVGTADLAAGTYNLVLTAAAWSVGSAQPAGTFSVSTSNNGVTLDAASTTTGVLPKIGSTVAVTSFAATTAADAQKIRVATTGATGTFTIGFTTTTALPANAFIQFTLPAAYFASNPGAGATISGGSTTAPTCTLPSATQLKCVFGTGGLTAGASTITLAAGWTPAATVNSAQFPAVTNSNKATYTISNLISPAKYLPAATYAANSNYQADFGTVGSLTECSAALAFPQFGTAPPSPPSPPGPNAPGASGGKALALSAVLALSSIMLLLF